MNNYNYEKEKDECEYVCIDFETANGNLTSACSIGIVGAAKGKILFEKYYLINPCEEFLAQNVAIHHITPEMVNDALRFDELWDLIKPLLDGRIVFAHAATFDIAVLKSLLDKYDLEYPNIRIGCTLKVSRIAFKGEIPNFRLGTISNHLQIEHDYHNAVSDASICFYLLERAKRIYQVYDVCDLFEVIALGFGALNPKFYRGCYNKLAQVNKCLKTSRVLEGKIIAFSGKPRTMTKLEAKKLVEANGGIYSKEITKAINTFVIFTNPVKAQMNVLNKVLEYKQIEILKEEDFKRIINGK